MLALLVAFSLILLTAYFGESTGGGLHSVQRGFLEAVSPIQEGASRALKPFRDLFGWIDDTLHAKGDVKDLRKQLEQERAKAIANEGAARTAAELQGLLNMDHEQTLLDYRPITARVIGRSPTVWYSQLTIDRGSGDGVAVDQPVVASQLTPKGEVVGNLVGKVTAVRGGVAIVTLITDHTSGVSAEDSKTGAPGIIQPAVGNPNDLLLQYLRRGDPVAKGHAVITAGTLDNPSGNPSRFRSIFPPGVPIGTITKIDNREVDLYQRVHVKPYADLRRLDFVQVLVRRNGSSRP